MQKAAHLLKDTSMTVTEISFALGYYDASNFRRVFKNQYHVTPQEYRETRQRELLT
ncbi:MAG: helix-turn-helix domain-containing protein [Clostridiales bacterium]|nr:helix-turn-helix domain-containing protein [Clostridiales bacterium]